MSKKAYYQGGGKENEPAPKKTKYEKEPLDQNNTKARGVFFKNYDLYDTGDPSPGTGFYQHMNEYDSVGDFRAKKRKEKIQKRRKALFEAIMVSTASKSDENNLDNPTENIITPIQYDPDNINSVGLFDNMHPEGYSKYPISQREDIDESLPREGNDYPTEDLEEKPKQNLYFGKIETHNIE